MFILAKLCGIFTLVWFYLTAKSHGGPVINWSVIGLIGYWLTWWISKLLIESAFAGAVAKFSGVVFLLPIIFSLLACFFIRKKLIAGISTNQQ